LVERGTRRESKGGDPLLEANEVDELARLDHYKQQLLPDAQTYDMVTGGPRAALLAKQVLE
jgi:hypothetical protein